MTTITPPLIRAQGDKAEVNPTEAAFEYLIAFAIQPFHTVQPTNGGLKSW